MKIKNAKGRVDGKSGYTRTIGNEKLGKLISRVQATVISNGTELERLLERRSNLIRDLDNFIDKATIGEVDNGNYLCTKRVLSKSRFDVRDRANKKILPDMLIFVVERRRICKVIELKDGDSFDTKKASGEKEHLEEFALQFGSSVPFVTEYYVCCFNQLDKDIIYTGFKEVFSINHIMTGKELCDILNIDYDEIIRIRKNDEQENFAYFLDELINIKEVKEYLKDKVL